MAPEPRTHPNGQKRIKILDVAKVYGDVVEVPLSCYKGVKRGWHTLVTPAQVEAASNQFDGAGILEDIDTQWGSKPEGGCYHQWDSD
ncbi:hypothetical protein PHLCEN_2v9434 [Hermanssonia centrifuga]|uniref:Uncharacterized protein n=1 Tax=Hermanssonia centrifuga TaxID=98765 RepID=A0A2R6NQT3_9APHY|nr:hypothetical protein PHLCEN_2v9434 [Hermanssonia centrifuga]